MANEAPEQELLGGGTRLEGAARGPFLQNLWMRGEKLRVRSGFGQITQLDSTLSLPPKALDPEDDVSSFGFQEVCGVFGFVSEFEHEQLLVVVAGQADTGNTAATGSFQSFYALVVYDVTTGRHIETVLHRHTSEQPNDMIPHARGTYNSNRDTVFADFLVSRTPLDSSELPATPEDHGVWFFQTGGLVVFGGPTMGVWCYRPIDVMVPRRSQTDGVRETDYAEVRADIGWCIPVVAQPGIFRGRYTYLTQGFFATQPTCGCALGLRSAFAQGRDVFISDMDRPGCVMSINILAVPSDGDITAMVSVNGILLIFTAREVWTFNPADGANVAAGDLRLLSATAGCANARLVTQVGNTAIWTGSVSGVWASDGMTPPSKISADIDSFWSDTMSFPLSSYYQNDGKSSLAGEQPRLRATAGDWRGASMHFVEDDDALVLNIPAEHIALVRQRGRWFVWTFDTVVINDEGDVGVNTLGPVRMTTVGRSVFLCGGVEAYQTDDETETTEGELHFDNKPGSFWLAKMERGGGLDRSVVLREDERKLQGWFELVGDATGNLLVIGEPVVLAAGYSYFDVTIDAPVTDADPVYLFPVYLKTDTILPDTISMEFTFDNGRWKPVFDGATPEVAFLLPPERGASFEGWGKGAPLVGSEIRCWDSGGAVYSQSGDTIKAYFDGSNGIGVWTHKPHLNITPHKLNPLFYLPLRRIASSNAGDAMSQGIVPTVGSIEDFADDPGNVEQLQWYIWHAPYAAQRHDADDVAQAVDWYFRGQVAMEDQWFQVRARDIYARVLSRGDGSNGIYQTWPRATFNATMAPDFKDWSAQLIDHQNGAITLDRHNPMRARFLVSPDTTPSRAVADSAATTPPKWGDAATPTAGNLLAGDPALDTAAISNRSRGEFVSISLWGHIRDKAESLVLHSVKVALQRVSGRRRRGR